ncbi:hypothetical protein R268_22515 [Salmonella enterica]|nr:hypothetical protein [Salmonella enterica]
MTTITKEQLISHARESVSYLEDLKGRASKEGEDCKVVLEMVERELELARIALASLEVEPVAEIRAHYPLGINGGKQKFVQAIGDLPDFGGHLYAAPPAPVAPEEKPIPNPLSMYAVDAVAAIAEVRGWNSCCAAMLHGCSNFDVNGNSPAIPDDWVMVPKEPTQAMIKAWRSEVANWRGHVAGYKAALAAAPQHEVK